MNKKEPLKDVAYQALKTKILNNEFKPNAYLDEKSLCAMLNISRTPIREAISKLEYENLVQTISQKGIFVTNLSIQSITELFQARKMIEPSAMQLCCKNLDKDRLVEFREKSLGYIEAEDISALHHLDYDFHNYFFENCSNRHIKKIMSYILDQFQRIRTQNFYPTQRTIRGAKEHIDMINALLHDEFDKISEMTLNHITSTETFYYKSLMDIDGRSDL